MTNYEKRASKDSETSQMAATDGLCGVTATSHWRLPELVQGSQPHVSLEEGALVTAQWPPPRPADAFAS